MSEISRSELHSRFCSLYGKVADELGVEADCVCQVAYDEAHELSMKVDVRPMRVIERRVLFGTQVVFAIGFVAGVIVCMLVELACM